MVDLPGQIDIKEVEFEDDPPPGDADVLGAFWSEEERTITIVSELDGRYYQSCWIAPDGFEIEELTEDEDLAELFERN